ncbi:hypothetical protein BDR22DRAFT_89603 [Usnea florida]
MVSALALLYILTIAIHHAVTLSLADIPSCAEQVAFSSLNSTGCTLSDYSCLCKDQSFISSLLPVVEKDCSPADLQKTIETTESFCDGVGITIAVPTSTQYAAPSASPIATPNTTPIATPSDFPSDILGDTPTGAPIPLFTTRIVSYNRTSASGATSKKSIATQSTTPTIIIPTPSPGIFTFTGVATKYPALAVWSGILSATIVFLLL